MIHTGVVNTFSDEKGTGTIRPDDGTPDVVVTIEAVRAAGITKLSVNQRLSYDVERHDDGTTNAVSLIADE